MNNHNSCDDLIYQIDLLLDDDRYEFAWPTLEGIQDTIKEDEHFTPKQWRAVQNIMNSVEATGD